MSFVPLAQAAGANLYPIAEVSDAGWVNVRRGDQPKSPVMGRVRTGDSFAVQAAGSRYLILDGSFAGGYISSEFVKLSGAQHPLIKMMANGVFIRAYPSLNGRTIASVNRNAYLAADKEGEWFAIKAGPFKGKFVSVKFAQAIDESGSAATQATPMIAKAAPGANLPPTAEESVTPAPEPPTPTPPPPPPPAEPVAETPAPAAIPPAIAPQIATLSGSNIRMRKAPSTNGKIAGVLKGDESFEVEKKNDWYEIKSGPHKGNFIKSDFVKAAEPAAAEPEPLPPAPPPPPPEPQAVEPAPEPEPEKQVAKLLGTNIRMRKAPGTNGKIAGVLKGNETFEVEKKGDWYEIKSGPHKGNFIKSDFVNAAAAETVAEVQPTTPEPPPPAPTQLPLPTPPAAPSPVAPEAQMATLSGSNIRMRKAPSTNGKVAGVLKGNETFEVEKKGDWYEIKSGPHKGNFIKGDFINAAASVASTAPPSTSTVPVAIPPPLPKKPEPPASPVAAWDAQKEQRFADQVAKAFQKKKNNSQSNQVLMPVFFEQAKSPSGNVNSQILNDQDIQVEAKEFFKILHKHITENWFDKNEIKAITPKEEDGLQWVSVASFKDTGVNVDYDASRLEIRLKVPPELRSVESLSLSGGRSDFGYDNLESASRFSSFFNINATEVFDSRNSAFDDRRAPLQAQLENGTNIFNFVVEAYGNYTEDRGTLGEGRSSFIREDVRLTKDLPSMTSRMSAGDVVYPVQSFQVYRQMKGVAVYRQFSMGTSKLTYPTGDHEVFLKNRSKVYIWVNDQLQKVVELPAGRHQLKDFQYTSGMNNVRFEIVDEFGQVEVQDHSYTASSELLKPGLHQFSYAGGHPSSPDSATGQRIYDETNTTFSAFHRYGFNNYFTGGANTQFDTKQSSFGLEGNFSLKTGYLRMESGYISTADVGSGYSLASSYNYTDYKGPEKTQRSLSAGLIYRSTYFSEFGTTSKPTTTRPLNFSVGYARGISKMMSANFGLNYIMNKGLTTEASNSFALRLGLSNRWSNGISANVSASHAKSVAGKDEISITAFMIWSFPKDKQTVSAYANGADSSTRLGWNYNPSSGADSSSYQANYRENKSEKGYGATASVNGNRARAAATHEVVLTKIDDPGTEANESQIANNVTTLQLGTSIVFAGGHFGIGRPVTDSFAIVSPIKSLSGQRLKINPDTDDNYLAKTDWLGAAVAPELSSYNPTTIIVGAKNLPLGISIPQDHFNIYPRYKSGYAFPLGTDANVYLQVQLVDTNGQPLGMASGLAINLDDTSAQPLTVFTTRRGIIQSEGFKSGRYRLEIALDKYQPIEFVLPEDAKEEYDLGKLVLKEKPKEK